MSFEEEWGWSPDSDYEVIKCNKPQSFADKYGNMTVGEIIELNKAAEWYCGHEVTAEGGE